MLTIIVKALGLSPDRVLLEPDVSPFNASRSTWQLVGAPGPESIIPLTVALKLPEGRRADLERTLLEVSDPTNADYGKHRTHAELKQILGVPADQVDRVRNFWKSAGAVAVEVSPTSDAMTVAISVASAEAALSTQLGQFSHPSMEKARIVRALAPVSVPSNLANDVLYVGELHQFPRPSTLKRGLEAEVASWPDTCSGKCSGKVTPSVLSKRYKVPSSSTDQANKKNSMAVAEFQGQYYEDSDLSSFGSECGVKDGVDTQVGANQPSAGVESELDIEYIKALAPEVPLTDVYVNQYSLLNWVNEITSLSNPPLVHSVSYGNDEAQQSSKSYMESCNTAFMKAGTMGLSILFASGDQGVCGREGCGLFSHKYHPDFPAASPYITAVGGTDFASKGVIGEEKAWSDGGGGFSDTFDIPSWQKQAVADFKKNSASLPPQKYWSNTGRGYPDIAALAGQVNPYCIVNKGRFEGVAGTSAACPVAAAIFAKLNGVRLDAGKKPLGFLNPFIYQNGGAFQDVTEGTITGGNAGGFTAIKGWDAATGWGTPDYKALAKLV